MRVGYVSMNSEVGLRPDELARELEARGFDSLWVPEHSHIPVSRASAFPSGGDLPEGYLHMMDPVVSLTAAAISTTRLIVGTGVCLLLERDVLEFACQSATLDVLSGGRLLLGVGVGWNREELANHRPGLAFEQRYRALVERIEALRVLWREDEAGFDGEFDRFSPSWVYPKPLRRRIPIAMGNAGPLGMKLAARHADHWCPIDGSLPIVDGKPDVEGSIAAFRRLVEAAGRDPEAIGITLFSFSRPNERRLERYAGLGVERVVVAETSAGLIDPADTRRNLDVITPLIEPYRVS